MTPGRKDTIIKIITWALRVIVGFVFVFSGFVKAIDPWGTLYKVHAYLDTFGIHVWNSLELFGVIFLCGIEFVIGVFLLTGSFRGSTPIFLTTFMVVMLPLTLWIAVADPVDDCGCFGDALIISNWATFWKNVFLMAAAIWLLKFNRKCGWIVTPAIQWIELTVSALFIVGISFVGYNYQPLMDFRHYPVGSLVLAEEDRSSVEEYNFIYEKDGVRKRFSEADELPDEEDGWHFIERVTTGEDLSKDENDGIRIWNEDEEDVTEDVIGGDKSHLLILMPALKDVSMATSWKINALYDWAKEKNMAFAAIVAGSKEDIQEWIDIAMASYPIYTADDTSIKEFARGNPAVVYISDGLIQWKSTLKSIEIADFGHSLSATDPMTFKRNDKNILLNVSGIYLAAMSLLIVLSFMPRLKNVFRKR